MYICTCLSVHQVHYRNARNARRVQQTRNSTKDIHICIHVNHRNARNARRIQRRRAIQLYIYIYIYVFMYITGTRGMQVDTTDAQFDYTYKHVCIYVHHRNSRHARRLQHRRAIQRPNGRVVFPYKRRQSGPLLLCLVLCSCSVFLQCVLAVSSWHLLHCVATGMLFFPTNGDKAVHHLNVAFCSCVLCVLIMWCNVL